MKRIKFLPAILIGMMCISIFSCSKSDVDTPPGGVGDYKVNILATQFDPATMTMLPGAKITWKNMDTELHSIVSDNATSFNSGNIAAGGSFSFTPVANGTYPYHCGLHPAVQGTLLVVTR